MPRFRGFSSNYMKDVVLTSRGLESGTFHKALRVDAAENTRERIQSFAGDFVQMLRLDAEANGTTVLRQMGRSALRGAAWGGAIGGTYEALQGGSFWTGAKEGAFNGAVGWSMYRTAMRGTGATSLNPIGKDGILVKGSAMLGLYSKDPNVSNQARAILSQRHMAAVTQRLTTGNT